jgi:membrane protease YdiL (CAAX protease family)
VDPSALRETLVRRRWLVVLVSGLGLILTKRLVDWPEPLVPSVLLYILVPLVLAWILGFSPRDIGLSLPEDRRGWTWVALLLAGAFVLAFAGTMFPSMMEYYPAEHWGSVDRSPSSFVPYEAAIAVVMLATELLYRGWLVLGTSERLGRWSILVSAVPYAIAHLGKPTEEVVFSLFAGLAFGLADMEARSILPSFLAHFTGSAVFDYLALGA